MLDGVCRPVGKRHPVLRWPHHVAFPHHHRAFLPLHVLTGIVGVLNLAILMRVLYCFWNFL